MTPAESQVAVHARGLSYRYPRTDRGLRDVDIEVRRGEVLAVVGPNGSGKSTFLRLLATDLRPGSGTLTLLGESASRPTLSLRRRITFAPDEPWHVLPLTGRENLRLFLHLRGRGEKGGPYGRPDEDPRLLDAFGMKEMADRPVAEYSFGMRRKLLIVETMAGSPELLLLDEPSVGLDPEGMAALQRGVVECAARGGSVVLATNEIRTVPFWADRILFLHRGRVAAEGSPPQLMERFRGRTRIGMVLADVTANLRELEEICLLPGVLAATRAEGGLEVESASGSDPLPELLRILLRAGIQVRDIRVRDPGLEDVFEAITGARLTMEGLENGDARLPGVRAPG